MWLCSDEVEEKPRLHTLHLNGLLELEVRIKKKSHESDSEKSITNQKKFQRSKLEPSKYSQMNI